MRSPKATCSFVAPGGTGSDAKGARPASGWVGGLQLLRGRESVPARQRLRGNGAGEENQCKAGGRETAIGHLPALQDLDLRGLEVTPAALEELLAVNPKLWQEEFAGIDQYLSGFGERVPSALRAELQDAVRRVHSSQV